MFFEFSYFLIFFFVFWLIHFFRRFLFWLYFWQLKEYRLDRLFDGIKENKKILWPRISSFALIFLVLAPLVSKINFLFESLGFTFYFFFALYSFYLFLKKRWALCQFTPKMVGLFIFCLALIGATIYFLNPTASPFILALEFLSLEIFFPWIFLILFCIFQVPIFFIKKWLIFKAKRKMETFKDLTVIGIAGSYGKTSTKEFLYQILSGLKKYKNLDSRSAQIKNLDSRSAPIKVLKTEGNENTEIAIAKTILSKLDSIFDIFICEMAAYRRGEIKAICNIVHPKIGILTGIADQHISLFGSFSNLLNTKYELIASLPRSGIAIFNGANKYCQKLSQRTKIKKYSYSASEGPFDIFAKEIQESKDSLKFKIVGKGGKEVEDFSLNLLGRQNIENFLAAVSCVLILGASLREIKGVSGNIKPPLTTMRESKGKGGAVIIDDSYSQNPPGVLAAIEHLKNYSQKKILLMPCLIELGKASSVWHKTIGEKIGKICDLAIITTPHYFEELKIGALQEGMHPSKILLQTEPGEILKKITPYLKEGNVILIEGRIPKKVKEQILKS